MGLSFKPLEKIAEGVVNQINPLDNDRTFSNPQGNPVTPAAPAPSVFQQATHNGLTNVAGSIIKPLIINPVENITETERAIAAEATNNQAATNASIAREKQNLTDSIPGQLLKLGYRTGQTIANVPGAVAGDIRGFSGHAPTAYEQQAINQGAQAFEQTPAAQIVSPVQKALSYIPAIAQDEQAAGYNPKQGLFKSTVIDPGEAALTAAGLKVGVPESAAAEAAPKEVPVEPTEAPLPTVTEKVAPPEAATPVEPVASPAEPAPVETKPTPVTEPAPVAAPLEGTPVANAIPKANTGVPAIDAAIDDVASQYSQGHTFEGNVEDVSKQSQGIGAVGRRAANGLRKVLKENLTPEENEAVSDALEHSPTDKLTSKAFKVYNAIKPLYDQAFDVRKAIKPTTNRVTDYLTRIQSNSIFAGGKRVVSGVKSKLGDLSSPYSESRTIGKFVSKDDVKYGNPVQEGLTNKGGGTFVDKDGKVYRQAPVGTRELEANGFGPYEHLISRHSGIYHGDTLSLKARAEAVRELATNPNAHGLFTKEQVDSGIAPKEAQPVTQVTDLRDAEKNPLYAMPKDVKTLNERLGNIPGKGNLAGKAYDAISNAATQFIVLNPFFHGMNQLYQAGIAAGNIPGLGSGWLKVADAFSKVNEDDMRDYLEKGGHSPTYGSDRDSFLSKVTKGATKLNTKALAAYELRMRTALYKASIDNKMSPAKAIENIDRFLGDDKHIDPTIRRATLFFHYFRTMAKAIGHQVAHPIEQKGSIVNTAYLAGITAAVSYGYQQFTGNSNAYVRAPGELGLLKEGVEAVNDLRKGQIEQSTSGVTNRINPVLKEGAQQIFNKDLFTGQSVASDRGGHALTSLVAPASTGSKVTEGKRSITELIANQAGLDTPHAKGYQAAPKVSELNTKGAITEKTGDPTGYRQQQKYFSDLGTAQKAASADGSKTASQFADYLARSKDPVTGQTIQNSPAESIQSASALFANDGLRNIVQKFEQSQASHDPVWDLPPAQLKAFEQYKAMYTGDADKTNLLTAAQNGTDNWITDIEAKENDFYKNLPAIPGAKAPEANAQTPTYPVFDPTTTALLAAYDTADSADRSTLLQNNAAPLSTAFNDIANWTNAMRKAEGAPALQGYPEASPQVQAILNTYDALPKGDGSNGGSPERSAWINANPDAYAQMSDYLTNASVYSLVKNASEAQFAGSPPDQQLLKDIKNVGTNDIATTTGVNGGPTLYSLNPAAAYTQNNAASSSYANSILASTKASSERRDASKAATAAKRTTSKNYSKASKFNVKLKAITPYRIKAPKVGGKFKVVQAKPTTKGRISLKSTA